MLCSAACVDKPVPLGPTSIDAANPHASVALTVRVLTRGTEQPITGATVSQNSTTVGRTGDTGELRTNVPLDVEFHISVSAAGYVGFGAIGTVRDEERWTFYLESAAESASR